MLEAKILSWDDGQQLKLEETFPRSGAGGSSSAEIEEIVTSLLIEHSKPQLRFRFFTCDMSVSYLSVRFEEGVQIRLNF